MTEILTQDKLDELLSMIDSGEIDPEEYLDKVEYRKVKIYDFKRPDKFTNDTIRTISMIHEIFARLITADLSNNLDKMAHFHVASVSQLTYEEFTRSITNPTNLSVLHSEGVEGYFLVEIPPEICNSIVSLLTGVDPEHPSTHKEIVTRGGQYFITDLFNSISKTLNESWKNIVDLKSKPISLESNPFICSVVPPSDMVLCVTLETKVHETEGMLNICYPYITLESIIDSLTGNYWYSNGNKSDERTKTSIDKLKHVEMFSGIGISAGSFSLKELKTLKVGNELKIDIDKSFFIVGEEVICGLKSDISQDCVKFHTKHRITSSTDNKKVISKKTHTPSFTIYHSFPDMTREFPTNKRFDFLYKYKPLAIFELLKNEQYPIIAVILKQLKRSLRCKILKLFDKTNQLEITTLIKEIKEKDPNVIRVLELFLRDCL